MMLLRRPLGLLLLAWAMAAGAAAQGENSSAAPPEAVPPPKPKPAAKHVYTEDDLRRIRGGVSVVGVAEKPAATAKPAASKRVANEFGGMPAEDYPKREPKPEVPKEANCPSGTMAYALDRILSEQGLDLGTDEWMARLFGGPGLCKPLPGAEVLATQIAGDYTKDARHFHISVTVYPDSPARGARQAAELEGRHFLVLWKGNAYVLEEFDYEVNTVGGTRYRTGLNALWLTDAYHGTNDQIDMHGYELNAAVVKTNRHNGLLDIIATPR